MQISHCELGLHRPLHRNGKNQFATDLVGPYNDLKQLAIVDILHRVVKFGSFYTTKSNSHSKANSNSTYNFVARSETYDSLTCAGHIFIKLRWLIQNGVEAKETRLPKRSDTPLSLVALVVLRRYPSSINPLHVILDYYSYSK
jgi:hypothetical protein